MSKKKRFILCLAGLLPALLIFGLLCQRQQNRPETPLSRTSFLLNTVVTVTLYDSSREDILEEAMELCSDYERIFSRTLPSSELWQLNHGELPPEEGLWQLSPELAQLIQKGLSYGELSGGAFDITIEPVSSLWDFTSGKLPDPRKLQAALPLVDYRQVRMSGRQLSFAREGMALDLGAIAKGYIADRLKEFLLSQGVESALINLGGNVLCVGRRPEGAPFSVGIQKPFAPRSETALVLGISDRSVVSSGVYERCFEQEGTLYHHLLNPDTGYPWDNALLSVTVISDRSVDGDGLSTACFALGLERGMALIDSLPGVQAVFITDDGQLHFSQDFQEEVPILSQDAPAG